jgi:uncharacterized protein DUF1592/uncharacterized protein DUF1588
MPRVHANRIVAFLLVVGTIAWCRSMVSAQSGVPPTVSFAREGAGGASPLDTYCATCHNDALRSASGTLLIRFNGTHSTPELWARAYRQLQAGAMPPMGAPRPDRATVDAMLASIAHALGAATARSRTTSAAIASRLASMLWNSVPDAALSADAQHDRLNDSATLERHIQRMLADDRAQAFVARFFFPWLQLDTLGTADPDTKYFPEFNAALRAALAKETELFLLSQLREDREPIDLWTADYTFLNAQLAEHYGIANVIGPQFRRVASTPERAGLLGHGSVLMVTSRHQHGVDAGYTTPATRAKWVRLHFLGASLPNGFPGAPPVRPELPITPQTRALPADPCVNCHRNFFPLGYALENFDPIGRWRTNDQAGPVDASGAFVDGTPMNGVNDLRRVLLTEADAFRTNITEELLVYAATGSVSPTSGTPGTLVRARQILRSTPQPRWSQLIAAVVRCG